MSLKSRVEVSALPPQYAHPVPPLCNPDPLSVLDAARLLSEAERPLIIVGKGAAYARAEKAITDLIQQCNLPFLATPMG